MSGTFNEGQPKDYRWDVQEESVLYTHTPGHERLEEPLRMLARNLSNSLEHSLKATLCCLILKVGLTVIRPVTSDTFRDQKSCSGSNDGSVRASEVFWHFPPACFVTMGGMQGRRGLPFKKHKSTALLGAEN